MRSKAFGVVGMTLLVAGLSGLGLLQQIPAQTNTSFTKNGVYTEEQADQGNAIYTTQCAMCHGNALQGVGPNVALAGDVFLKKWTGQTMADLFSKTITTMPAIRPGSLTPAQTAQVLSYILAQNKFQPGKTELPTDSQALIVIHIDKP